MKKALIAMSGGVDSSVAAYIMKQRGFDCIGVTMKLFDSSAIGESSCCSADDAEDARSVAYRLGMPFYVFSFADDFREKVMDSFVRYYENGMTPNPCVRCNKYLKFGRLYERARELGCEYVVTGHYALIEKDSSTGKYLLKKAHDDNKDQTYMLYTMTQEQLSHTLFPLAELDKPQVREVAEKNGFLNARKHDSQDICFVPDGDYAGFIERYTGKKYPEGDITDTEGNVVGRHRGVIRYTVGQRRGIGVALSRPVYVCKIDTENNRIILGDRESLMSNEVIVSGFNWISGEVPAEPFRCSAKIRYRHREQPCEVRVLENGDAQLIFDEPQRAVTPGQSAVLYDGDTVLGGGIIIK